MKSEKGSLALYIHIPFCVRKCLYCDFHSMPGSEEEKGRYVHTLCREIRAWGALLAGRYAVSTVFLGGGTPSCLPASHLVQIADAIQKSFAIQEHVEYTIEVNPGTVTKEYIQAFHEMGIGRVSLGLQSAQDAELKTLGRIHSYVDFIEVFEMLRENGFCNINVDLMSAIPGQTEESYRDTLSKIVKAGPEHISAYSLIVEPGTYFFELEQKGLLHCPDEDADRRMYEYTEQYLSEHGYRRYEISNYAREGKECRHNITYWTGGEYLGIGENASSYFNGYRFRVPVDRKRYQEYVGQLENTKDWMNGPALPLDERRKLSTKEQMEEYMFLGLRMIEGISTSGFQERFGTNIDDIYGQVISKHINNKLLTKSPDGSRIALTRRGIDVSNYVLADFLLE